MKKIFAFILSLFAIISCLQEERSPEEILVPTPAQVECSSESLMLTSKVPSGSERLVQDCGFYYSLDKSMSDVRKVEGVLASNNFMAELPERSYGKTYYICSYVTNGHGSEIRSDLRSYTLNELDDYVEFGALDMLSYDKNSSTLEITIDAEIWGGVKITEIGVCYGDSPTGLDVDGPHKVGVWNRTQTKGDAGVVTISIDGLSDATQYYFRGYLKDDDYISYSDVLPFYIPAIPAVQTGVVEDITPYTAVLYGEVLDECGSPVSERGFVWNEGTIAPTVESDKVVVEGALGVMNATAEGLLPNKTYTFCAYAVNVSGVAYGAPVTFTTLVALPDLSVADITAVTSNSATFGGTVTNDGGETVSEAGFYYSTDSAVDPEKSQKVSQEYAAYQRTAAEFAANTLYSAMSAGSDIAMSKASSVETKAASDGYTFSIDVYGLALKTRYYVKAYAVNSAGIAYGKVTNFETMGEIPTVKTSGTSELTTSSVVLSGEVVSDNGERISERGFVWMEGAGTPTTDSHKVKVSGTTGEYNYTLNNLQPNSKYSFCAYAINAEGTSYGEVITFTTMVALPTVTPTVVSSVTSTSATLAGTVKDHGGETVYEVGFYYSTDSAVDPSTAQKKSVQYSADSFSIDITDLAVNTKYYVKSYAVNSAGPSYSTVTEFTTESSYPSVTTLGSSDVTEFSALLSGKVESDNGAVITERGFVWCNGTDTPTTSSAKLVVEGTTGEFAATLSGIQPNQKYSFRAYAINSKGTSYGATLSFSTIVGMPSVSGTTIGNITSTSATFSSKVESHGGETASEVGFCYSTDEGVDESSSKKVTLIYSNDSFSANVSDLAICTKYYVRSFVKNSAGEVYGPVTSFTTLASIPVVETVGFAEVTSTGAVLTGNVVTDNGATVSERGFAWVKGTDVPTTSSNRLKAGGTTGEYTASLGDLEPNQKYSFRAYAINSVGTAYGEIMTVTTSVGLPALSALGVSSITTTSATFTSTVTNHGGETVGAVGFYLSTSTPIDRENAQKISMAYVEDRFTYTAEDLSVGTQYYVMAFASNTAGEVVNAEVGFKTVSTAPTVVTKAHSEITSSSAKLSGEVMLDNGEPVTERGFVWLKGTTEPTASSAKLKADGTLGEYTSALTGLDPNQTYSYRAYATNSKGTAFGEVKNFRTLAALPEVEIQGVFEITSTTAEIDAKVTFGGGETPYEAGFLYGTSSELDPDTATKAVASSVDNDGAYYYNLAGLNRATQYYIMPYATNSAGTAYGKVEAFKTLPELPTVTTSDVTDITETTAKCGGVITDDGGEVLSKGIVWSRTPDPTIELSTKTEVSGSSASFTGAITGLSAGFPYYVRAYVTNSVGTTYGEQKQFTAAGEIQSLSLESANSYIIPSAGYYSFDTVKGNSYESVGSVASAEVLWESFGTSETPEVGSLISFVTYKNDRITFATADNYREGNAVIAAKDASGTILWSWHIWLTDQPQEQVYYNNAGTMMDRNLGATSATPGDVGTLGLMYQWGRKDPFLGALSISSNKQAVSTNAWTINSGGNREKTEANPMTFYTGMTLPIDSWTTQKTIYDPCPAGWRVPDGEDKDGVWTTAKGSNSGYHLSYDNANGGINFSGDLGNDPIIWYPTSGRLSSAYGYLESVGSEGYYWSCSGSSTTGADCLIIGDGDGYGYVVHNVGGYIPSGYPVRCFKEGTGGGPQYFNDFSTSGAMSLSDAGTANSYIVSSAGTYSIPAVKGNSSESVGSVVSAEVLWESLGTMETVYKGGLVSGAKYENGKIYFKTADSYREGNAVVAAKDASGTILWSWHIWLTDQPETQIYYNNAGTMMDRNLGATSATPGEVGALGLLYQWGRKDPFLGAMDRSSESEAYSTITWPSKVWSNATNGTIEYATSHPTTFITYNSSNYDWYYTGSSSVDNTRWQSEKTIYDPCPVGWRVPDGGSDGIWSNAGFSNTTYDEANKGISFSISSPSATWYPALGYRDDGDGALDDVGYYGYYWSATPAGNAAYNLRFDDDGYVNPSSSYNRAGGFGVRCFKEGTGPVFNVPSVEIVQVGCGAYGDSFPKVLIVDDGGAAVIEVGFKYGTDPELKSSSTQIVTMEYVGNQFESSLFYNSRNYYIQAFATNRIGTGYSEIYYYEGAPDPPTVQTNEIRNVTSTTAESGGVILSTGEAEILDKGLVWDIFPNPTRGSSLGVASAGTGESPFTITMKDLMPSTRYYVRSYAINERDISYGEQKEFMTNAEDDIINLATSGTANSYIVSNAGKYNFPTVKGNSLESVGPVASAEILWESFGTTETPQVGSLISSVSVQSDVIVFNVAEPYREGNAVIAAKDASGTILWSWHIWLTDQPQEQVYFNNAGTMMDRNLGATSATPGDVGALGLLYQWGRKDPFLGSSSISSDVEAKSTITWPSVVSSDSSNGTIEYAIANPTTFIAYNRNNNDWYYTGSDSTDDTRWQSDKTIYDPCPAGWRVPDGGENGVWSKALGSSSSYTGTYDSTNEGMNFSSKFGSASTIWYPASSHRYPNNGSLSSAGYYGNYLSCSQNPSDNRTTFYFSFRANGDVNPSNNHRLLTYGYGVRCVQE